MDDELDLAIALSLQQRFNNETKKEHSQYGRAQGELEEGSWDPKSIVDKKLELTDPNPNIHDLFVQYDAMFFWSKLVSCGVAVRWSPRMTLYVVNKYDRDHGFKCSAIFTIVLYWIYIKFRVSILQVCWGVCL